MKKWKKVWIRAWVLLYILWSVVWLSPLWVAIKCLIQLSIRDDEQPPPLPPSWDRKWYNWLWRVMQLLSRVCWKKRSDVPPRIMLLYGTANLHWAITCWDHAWDARIGMCCHVAESICSKYIMYTVAKSTRLLTAKCFVIFKSNFKWKWSRTAHSSDYREFKRKVSPVLSVPLDHINPQLQKYWALFIHLTHKW